MDYHTYTVEDFVLDARFRKWILQPDRETNLFWEAWIVRYPEKAHLLYEARLLLLHLPHEKHRLPADEIDKLWNTIDQLTTEFDTSGSPDSKVTPLSADATLKKYASTTSKKWNYIRTGRMAASIVLALALGLSYLLGEMNGQTVTPTQELLTKETTWGQRSTIYLSDGSEVHLNAGSSIEYEKKFNEHERLVTLHGEAFFKVSRDPKRPFRVISLGITTEALGTSFNINAYHTDKIEVALVSGKVAVDVPALAEELILTPGEAASYQSDQGLSKYLFNSQQVLSWKDGIIYFKNADEFTVFNTLERWYGVSFEKRNNSKKSWDYTGTFEKKSLEHVLMSMAFAMDFDYKINQKEVIINYK